MCVLSALYELAVFDAADAVVLDQDYDVQQFKTLLAKVATDRTIKRPATGTVKAAEEQKTNDEESQQQQSAITASPDASTTNVCTFDLKHCGLPRSS